MSELSTDALPTLGAPRKRRYKVIGERMWGGGDEMRG